MKLRGHLVALTRIQQILGLLVFIFFLVGCHKQDQSATSVLPAFVSQSGSVFTLTLGKVSLQVDADLAARVCSMKINGQEILVTPKEINTGMWGSSFWTSPQSDWNWPPLVTLDGAPYKIESDEEHLIFTSKIDEISGFQFIKKFGIDKNKNAFSIQYTIINHNSVEKHIGPWEVTRFKPRGHIFFPTGNLESFSGIFYPLTLLNSNGISWFDYDPAQIKNNHHKLMTDGKEGWVAYTDKRFVLIKEFKDVPPEKMVPGEAEIGIFASGKKDYLEIAEQGEYTSLAPHEKLEWSINWHLVALPDGIENAQENSSLVDFVRKQFIPLPN